MTDPIVYGFDTPTSLDQLPWIDVTGTRYVQDPYAVLREARADSWIFRSDRGVEILRYEPQRAMLRDRRLAQDHALLAQSAGLTNPEVWRFRNELLVNTKGPDHARLRSTVASFFSKGYVETLRAQIRSLIEQLLTDAVDPSGGPVDIFESVCRWVPALTYCLLVRAPAEDAKFVARMSDDILKLFARDPSLSSVIEDAYMELFEYTDKRFAFVANNRGDDLLSYLISAIEGGKLSRREAADLAVMTLEASTDNTANQMAMVLSVILEEAGAWQALVADSSLMPQAVEEAIRMRPRTLNIDRVALEDITWRNLEVPKGTAFVLSTMITNRDPEIYPHPETFDMYREKPAPQLMFGGGMTACLGANLARVEIQELVAALTLRYPDLALYGTYEFELARHVAESGGLNVVMSGSAQQRGQLGPEAR